MKILIEEAQSGKSGNSDRALCGRVVYEMRSDSPESTKAESASSVELTDGGIATHQDKLGAEIRILQIIPCSTPVFGRRLR
jgi:hypothetical protein